MNRFSICSGLGGHFNGWDRLGNPRWSRNFSRMLPEEEIQDTINKLRAIDPKRELHILEANYTSPSMR